MPAKAVDQSIQATMARKMAEFSNGFNFKTVVVLYWIEINYQNIDKSYFRIIASAHKLRGVTNDRIPVRHCESCTLR